MMRYIWISAALAGAVAAAWLLFFWSGTPRNDVTDMAQVDFEALEKNADIGTAPGDISSSQPQDYKGNFALPGKAAISKRPAGKPASVPHSAMERAMLSNGMVNETAIKALKSKQFDRLLTDFDSEQMGMTTELTVSYRAELMKLLDTVSQPKQIDRLVCGTDLCIASIRSSSADWYPAWLDSVQARSGLPMHALTGNTIDHGGGDVEYRLLFTISDDVKGFTGSAPRS